MAKKKASDREKLPKEISNIKKVELKKAKITNENFLYTEYTEHIALISNGGTKRIDIGGTLKRDGENMIHDDLKSAFAKLNIHLALLAEMLKKDYATDQYFKNEKEMPAWANMDDFTVTGFVVSNGDEGVTLIGQKKLSTGKILNLVTPYEKWENSQYAYADELAEAIQHCKGESLEYLNGKMAPPAQQEIGFEDEARTEEAAIA